MAWAKNGTPDTLSGTLDTAEITDLTTYKFNQFMSHVLHSGAIITRQRYDADAGNNYAFRYSRDGGADSTGTSAGGITSDSSSSSDHFIVGYWVDISGEEVLVISFCNEEQASGAGTAPSRQETVGKYINSDNTQVSLNQIDSGSYIAGSNLSAIGTD